MAAHVTVERPSSKPGWVYPIAAAAAAATVTLLAYLGWLGWDQHRHRVPGTSSFEGPYSTAQVLGLAATLAVLAIVVTWRGLAGVAIVAIPLVLTLVWSVDAAGDKTIGANLWPVGAVLLAMGSLVGILIVCGATHLVKRILGR